MTENGFRAPLPEELAPLFPSYRILSLIATGGMGAVYRAVQTSLDREVAIKILPVESGHDPEFCRAFAAEAKAMAKLNHPNLIGVYDFGEVNGTLFIVMEYVPGKSLHEACNGCALDPAEVIRLMTGISHGLAHAHQHGILHRDIKPANILLDAQLLPKIGDFGLARPMDAQVGLGETIYGTPGYTAPEVLQPPHAVDQRADIFSLGVLMHELLTGQLPGSDPRPPSAISRCDPRFDAVVQKATHPDPRQRYQSATEIAEALQKIASTAGPRVLRTATNAAASRRPAVQAYPMQAAGKNGGGGWVVVTLLLIVGALVVLFLIHQLSPNPGPGPEPSRTVQPQPTQVAPEPAPLPPQPERVKPVPEPVIPVPKPVQPEPAPVAPLPKPVTPQPEPAASDPVTGGGDSPPTVTPQPQFDVDAFLVHARSVMVKRCAPVIAKRNEGLDKNLADFKSDARRLIKTNLEAVYHQAAERELDDYLGRQKPNGNRLGEELEKPLKFKKWLVELHKDYQQKEIEINEEMIRALAEHQKTYLYGLELRVKALREADDPAAADLIQAEMDKVKNTPDYFPGLMQEAMKG